MNEFECNRELRGASPLLCHAMMVCLEGRTAALLERIASFGSIPHRSTSQQINIT